MPVLLTSTYICTTHNHIAPIYGFLFVLFIQIRVLAPDRLVSHGSTHCVECADMHVCWLTDCAFQDREQEWQHICSSSEVWKQAWQCHVCQRTMVTTDHGRHAFKPTLSWESASFVAISACPRHTDIDSIVSQHVFIARFTPSFVMLCGAYT